MCGRFANQQDNTAAWDAYFDCDNEFATIADTVSVGYNIAPTQTIPVVTPVGWLAARLGMVGAWVKDASEISSKFATSACQTRQEHVAMVGLLRRFRICISMQSAKPSITLAIRALN